MRTRPRYIVIEQRVTGKDSAGQALDTWTTVVSTYGTIVPTTGRETVPADADVSQVASTIEIKFRTNITAGMRARYAGRVFNIQAVFDVDTRHEWLRLTCSEGLNQG